MGDVVDVFNTRLYIDRGLAELEERDLADVAAVVAAKVCQVRLRALFDSGVPLPPELLAVVIGTQPADDERGIASAQVGVDQVVVSGEGFDAWPPSVSTCTRCRMPITYGDPRRRYIGVCNCNRPIVARRTVNVTEREDGARVMSIAVGEQHSLAPDGAGPIVVHVDRAGVTPTVASVDVADFEFDAAIKAGAAEDLCADLERITEPSVADAPVLALRDRVAAEEQVNGRTRHVFGRVCGWAKSDHTGAQEVLVAPDDGSPARPFAVVRKVG